MNRRKKAKNAERSEKRRKGKKRRKVRKREKERKERKSMKGGKKRNAGRNAGRKERGEIVASGSISHVGLTEVYRWLPIVGHVHFFLSWGKFPIK